MNPMDVQAELSSPDPKIRRQALLRLAGVPKSREILNLFLQIAQRDPEARIKLLARQLYQETRASLGEEASVGLDLRVGTGEFDPANLEAVFRSGDPSARLEAIRQALKDPQSEILESLRKQLSTEKDPWVIAMLLKAIGQRGDAQDISRIQPYLSDKDLRIQANAIEALELIGDELAFSLVAPMLQSSDSRIRANAVKCLVRCDPEEALNTLERLAESSDVKSRESALYCMGIVEHPRIVTIISRMLAREDEEVLQKRQIQILAEEGDPKTVGALAYLVDHGQGEVQETAAIALGRIRSRHEILEDDLIESKLAFEREVQASRPDLAPDPTLSAPTPETSALFDEIEAGPSKKTEKGWGGKKKSKAPPPEEPKGFSLAVFLKENPAFLGLSGITALFLVASVVTIARGPTSKPPPKVTKKPTKVEIDIGTKTVEEKGPKAGETRSIYGKVKRLNKKRNEILFVHEEHGRVKIRLLKGSLPKELAVGQKFEAVGAFSGKKVLGSQIFDATKLIAN